MCSFLWVCCLGANAIRLVNKNVHMQCGGGSLLLDHSSSKDKYSQKVRLTGEEALHAVAAGHFQQAAARVRGQGRVGSIRQ